ncbi:glycerophosphodiester phosphodiesterase family protein [Pseudovibrio sp. SPO723]|uniref:glycerophosphodiester phosphodiesterase family protein n=1 Tax=Nesiotobacter zosterae TaxID=392721 RepID=UPI0029C42AE2|nr:glycerophosphodiester phosphodiesterase family protein [Pseudovibrio sp. SPO723]MDX5593497.1 glycerophosphodiester phosphodiesterase family protein [Pseudovibrio sp. SPO723]
MKPYRDFIRGVRATPTIVAHRGAWHNAPENSVQSILNAAEAGYEIVEIDVRRSRDDVLFICHDDTLERMAGKDVPAESLTIAELKELRLKARDGGENQPFTEHLIPTLGEALEAAKDRVYLDIDVKIGRDLTDASRLVSDYGMSEHVDLKVKVQTAEQASLLLELQQANGVMVMPMTRFEAHNVDVLIDLLAETGASIVETKFDDLNTIASRADRFREAGLAVWVNTLDGVACCGLTDTLGAQEPAAVWGRLMDAGVSVIQTDEPEALQAYRSQLAKVA